MLFDAQLAHMKSGPLGSAYDRAGILAAASRHDARVGDYCDSLRNGTTSKLKMHDDVRRIEVADRRPLPHATVACAEDVLVRRSSVRVTQGPP
jgi:hypothetical protein